MKHIEQSFDRIRRAEIYTVGLFFLMLFLGLFLGDGKQSVVEVYGSAICITCWILMGAYRVHIRPLEKQLFISWVVIAVVAAVSSMFSGSVGYSISWFVRFACSYLIFRLFYTIASKESLRMYLFCFTMLVFGGATVSLFITFFPWLKALLPSMNLIDVRYGHSHLADLLVFVTPIIYQITSWNRKKHPVVVAVGAVIYTAALILTFSRGAWIIVSLYGVIKLGIYILKQRRKTYLYIAFGSAVLSLFVLVGFFYEAPQRLPEAVFRPISRPITTQSRVEYIRQAIVGFIQHPVLGSGPGTFSLVSQEQQNSMKASSWFVHSYPLQLVVETGIIGFFSTLWLFYLCGRIVLKNSRTTTTSEALILQEAIVIVFAYAAFEFVLDYLITSLLFWGGVGMIVGVYVTDHTHISKQQRPPILSLIILCIFYLLWAASAAFSYIFQRYDMAYYLAPFDAGNAMVMLQGRQDITANEAAHIEFFHKKNSAILMAIATAAKTPDTAIYYYNKAIQYYPNNVANIVVFLRYLIKMRRNTAACNYLNRQSVFKEAPLIDCNEVTSELLDFVGDPQTQGELYAKIYYFIGFKHLNTDQPQTELYWIAAIKSAPGWGHFYVELASLYYRTNGQEAAQAILRECLAQYYPKKQCESVWLKTAWPGNLYKDISVIPRVL